MAPAKSNAGKSQIAATKTAKKAPANKAASGKAANKAAAPQKVKKVSIKKPYYKAQFRRPHTFRKAPAAKPSNSTKVIASSYDEFRIIRRPLMTDCTMKKIEENNTLTFICDPHATKTSIKRALATLYKVKAVSCNTMITPQGDKKAYCRLAAAHDAMDVAGKIGIM